MKNLSVNTALCITAVCALTACGGGGSNADSNSSNSGLKCTAPQVLNSATNKCEDPKTPPKCTAPQVLNTATNKCEAPKDPLNCTEPLVYNATTNQCETPPPPKCTATQVLDPTTNKCEEKKPPTCVAPQILNPATNECQTPTPTASQFAVTAEAKQLSDGLKCNAGTVIREQAGIDCFTGTYTGKTVLGGETCTLDITDKRMLKYTAGGKSWTINSPGKTIATVSQGELVNGQPPVKVGVLGVTSSDNKLAIGLRINTKAERWVNYFEGALINVGIVGNKDGHPPVCVIGKPNPTPTPKMEGVGRAWTIAAKYSDLLRGGPDAKPGAEINYGYSLGLYYGDAFRYPDAAEAGARYFSKLNSGVFTGKTSTGRACKVTINPADLSFKLEEGSFSYSSTGLVSATDYKKDYGFISADGSAGNILVGYVNSILELRDAQSAKLSFTHLPLINNSKPDEYSGTSFTYEKGTEKSTCYLE